MNMKLLLASFATGSLATIGLFIALMFVRALLRDEVSVTVGLWIFAWPVWLLRYVPGISEKALPWVSLGTGMLLDIVFISLVTYGLLRLIVSKRKPAPSTPPQAPTF